MEQPRERIMMVPDAEKKVVVVSGVLEKEITVVLEVPEAEEEAEALEEIRGSRTRLEPTSSAMSARTASTTTSCSMTRWPCQASTASLAATAETVGGLRRGAT